jgi:hypothetical protein
VTCTHCRTSLTEWSAVYCPHSRAFCEACTFEDACEDCGVAAYNARLRVRLDKAADGAIDHLRRGELADARSTHDADLGDWSSIAEDRSIRRNDTSGAASDRLAERYFGGWSA